MQRDCKVLFLSDHIFSFHGGKAYSYEFAYENLAIYAELFGKVKVMARYRDIDRLPPDIPEAEGENVQIIRMENLSTLKSYLNLRRRMAGKIEKELRDAELLIARLPGEIALLGIELASEMGKSILAEVAGCAYDMLRHYGGIKAALYAPIMESRVRRAVKRADAVRYVTDRYLQSRYPPAEGALTASIAGVRLERGDETEVKSARERLESLKGDIVLGTIANIDMRYKGIERALENFALVKREFPCSIYKIGGPGERKRYEALCRRLGVEDSVVFDGVLPSRESVRRWLRGIDIYIQPSFAEGLPRALIEAMGEGCVVVASNVGGIPEVLDEEFIFDIRSRFGLYSKIKTLSRRDDLFDIAMENFRLSRKFTADIMDEKRRAFYEEVRDSFTSTTDEG
jgi:glycosyltransferase involved in cell wall biosynthesis